MSQAWPDVEGSTRALCRSTPFLFLRHWRAIWRYSWSAPRVTGKFRTTCPTFGGFFCEGAFTCAFCVPFYLGPVHTLLQLDIVHL